MEKRSITKSVSIHRESIYNSINWRNLRLLHSIFVRFCKHPRYTRMFMGFYRGGNSIDLPSSCFPSMEENSHLVDIYQGINFPSPIYINLIITMTRDSIFQIIDDARCMWHARSKRQSSSRVVKFRTIEILITWMHRENFIIFFYSPKNLLFSNLLFPSECRFSSLWIKVSKRLKIPKSL